MGRRVIVIGAGLGGISAAISLQAAGYQVELFEKNQHLGGKLNLREVQGFRFDLGPSIIILPQLFRRLFQRAGRRLEDYLQLDELKPQWRSFFEDGTVIDLHPDVQAMERELERLGDHARGYWAFLEHSRMLYKFAEEAYFDRGADTLREISRGHGWLELARKTDITRTMHEGIAHFVREPHLLQMLGFFIKYVGSSVYDAPGMLNLLAYSQLGYGLFYVRGGMYNLARGCARLMEELGVKVHLGAEVTRILKQGDRVEGVQLAGGEEHRADLLVSNMEVIPAYRQLLGEGGFMMKKYEYLYPPSCSGLVVHLGVEGSYPQLAHHDFFFARDQLLHFDTIHRRKQLPEDPTIYLVCPTVTQPDLAPPGHSLIKILPHIPHIPDRPFTEAEYRALKERVYDKLERMGLQDLRRRTVVEDVLVPEDIQRMYYSNRGSIYGVVSDRRHNFAFKAPKRSERYRNLYFVGGSVNPGGGTPMVVLCGQLVADRIVRDQTES